jgi:hypothetical protein
MFRARFLLASLLFTSSITACMSDDDGIWMPPGSSGGKADGVQILKAADIPSQYVQAGKHYLTGRRIDTLEQVGALTGTEDMLAKRADGIIANLPANGRIEAAELVRMENAQIFATLFPDEQAALPKLWPLLLAPTPNAGAVDTPTNNLTFTEQVTQPGGLTEPASLQISTLPTELQTVARRVELVFNADGNANTIQVTDIDKVLTNPQAFTPTEVQQLDQIKAIFHERATSVEEAKALVPTPGHTAKTTAFGQTSIELSTDVALVETRSLQRSTYYGLTNWSARLQLDLTLGAIVQAPSGDQIVIVELDSGDEVVLAGGGANLGHIPAGDLVLERYSQGQRQSTHDVAFPPFAIGTTSTDLSQYLDYKLVTANQAQLVRNPVSIMNSSNSDGAVFHHELTPTSNTTVPSYIVDEVSTPKSALPTGRYEVQTNSGVLAIDLFPEGAVIARVNGVDPVHLAPSITSGAKALAGNTGGLDIAFVPSTNRLEWSGGSVTLTSAQRTK